MEPIFEYPSKRLKSFHLEEINFFQILPEEVIKNIFALIKEDNVYFNFVNSYQLVCKRWKQIFESPLTKIEILNHQPFCPKIFLNTLSKENASSIFYFPLCIQSGTYQKTILYHSDESILDFSFNSCGCFLKQQKGRKFEIKNYFKSNLGTENEHFNESKDLLQKIFLSKYWVLSKNLSLYCINRKNDNSVYIFSKKIESLDFNETSRLAASGCNKGSICLWNLNTREKTVFQHIFKSCARHIALAINPKNQENWLFALSKFNTLAVINCDIKKFWGYIGCDFPSNFGVEYFFLEKDQSLFLYALSGFYIFFWNISNFFFRKELKDLKREYVKMDEKIHSFSYSRGNLYIGTNIGSIYKLSVGSKQLQLFYQSILKKVIFTIQVLFDKYLIFCQGYSPNEFYIYNPKQSALRKVKVDLYTKFVNFQTLFLEDREEESTEVNSDSESEEELSLFIKQVKVSEDHQSIYVSLNNDFILEYHFNIGN